MIRPLFDPKAAHKFSSKHREQVLASQWCGCFYCVRRFKPATISEWIDAGATALCPGCGIDSVIGDASGLKIDKKFLRAMFTCWFTFKHRLVDFTAKADEAVHREPGWTEKTPAGQLIRLISAAQGNLTVAPSSQSLHVEHALWLLVQAQQILEQMVVSSTKTGAQITSNKFDAAPKD